MSTVTAISFKPKATRKRLKKEILSDDFKKRKIFWKIFRMGKFCTGNFPPHITTCRCVSSVYPCDMTPVNKPFNALIYHLRLSECSALYFVDSSADVTRLINVIVTPGYGFHPCAIVMPWTSSVASFVWRNMPPLSVESYDAFLWMFHILKNVMHYSLDDFILC
jgi:hypothetical protein